MRVWNIDRREVLARLRDWGEELGRDRQVMAVVLFGSLARGDHTAARYADVLILLRNSTQPFEDRIARFLPTGVGIGVDVFPYTLAEAERALVEGWGPLQVALEEGLVLFERDDEGPLALLRRLLHARRG